MKIISNDVVASLLPMKEAIEVVETAMKAVARGSETLPLRNVIPVGGDNKMGMMPGAISDPACFGIKLVSLFPKNPEKGLSSHRGAIVLFESETGGAIAMMDAGLLTAIRTAAASGAATRALANEDASTLTLIGYGEQAEFHLDAMLAVRRITEVRVVGRSSVKAAGFAAHAAKKYPEIHFTSGSDVAAAVRGADIICTVTSSPVPVLNGTWLEAGMHLNIVGSSIPSMREVDDEVVLKSDIWVDYLPSWQAQAGEIVDMVNAGTIPADYLKGEIGAVYSGDLEGRSRPDQITFYRSLGIAAQDLATAHHVLSKAIELDLGQDVDF